MNFLAHLWLAERTATSLAGAVLGDVVRGADLSAYPSAIAEAVRLHRRVDAATDRHPRVVALRTQFPDRARRYAGIVLDLGFDHALALDWSHYSDEPLDAFCQRAGRAIADAHPAVVPVKDDAKPVDRWDRDSSMRHGPDMSGAPATTDPA